MPSTPSAENFSILTQFLAAPLHQHISTSYRQDVFSGGFIDLLSCEQKPSKQQWYQGTADAVRQNLEYFLECPVDYFLILSGDQIYQMDFRPLVLFAQEKEADLVVASLPVEESLAKRMGILQKDRDQKIVRFVEKPQQQEELQSLVQDGVYLASMGIYLFRRDTLINALTNLQGHDFGRGSHSRNRQGAPHLYLPFRRLLETNHDRVLLPGQHQLHASTSPL